jgi:hypothetical protein
MSWRRGYGGILKVESELYHAGTSTGVAVASRYRTPPIELCISAKNVIVNMISTENMKCVAFFGVTVEQTEK